MKKSPFLWFLLLQAVLSLAIYRGALWGNSLLVPLDCGPSLFPKFRYAEPNHSGIPSNHYLIDLFTYDLPLQYSVYHAYRAGEIPWWDPYTFAGRPLLADTPVNGTDPLRLLCYFLLPFEMAYNWVHVLYSFLSGLGMFLLLRYWKIEGWISMLLGLIYQFSSYFALELVNPTLQPSFCFYPFLWMAWDSWHNQKKNWSLPVAALSVAGVFYTGNPQSHAYVVLFAGAFLFGYGRFSLRAWRKLLPLIIASGVLGAMLAAPVLATQLEFFARNVRMPAGEFKLLRCFSGVLSLSAVFPWLLGTFRTLDLSKACGETALGFHLFIGSVGFLLAAFGAFVKAPRPELAPVRRTALGLVLIYLVCCSTPLLTLLYTRLAGIAIFGMVVLAAFGVEYLREHAQPLARTGWTLVASSLLLMLLLQLAAFVIYPRARPRAEQLLQQKLSTASLDTAPALRNYQLANLPNEISYRNPETLLAGLSIITFGLLCLSPVRRRHGFTFPLVLALNLLPQLWFYNRFLPNQPAYLWHRLRDGGPEQNRLRALLADKPLRLYQEVPGPHELAIPQLWSHVYHVRMVNGYSSLQPRSLVNLPVDEQRLYESLLADYIYESNGRGQPTGVIRTNPLPGTVLFQWLKPNDRSFEIKLVSFGETHLVFRDGPAGALLWTDSYYPGWRAFDGPNQLDLAPAPPCFTRIEVPAGARTVVLKYRPTYLNLSLLVSAAGLLSLLLAAWAVRNRWGAKSSLQEQSPIHNALGSG